MCFDEAGRAGTRTGVLVLLAQQFTEQAFDLLLFGLSCYIAKYLVISEALRNALEDLGNQREKTMSNLESHFQGTFLV